MDLQEFDVLLAAHDWTYAYADDYRYFTRGDGERRIILDHMRKQPELNPLFNVWADYVNGKIDKAAFDKLRAELLQ